MRCSILSLLFGGLLLTLPACNSRPDAGATETIVEDPAAPPATSARDLAKLRLHFSYPAFIDSSRYVLYPLVINEEETEGRYSSSSSSRGEEFWNIAFYSPRTGAAHLLADDRKMVIYRYGPMAQQAAADDDGLTPAGSPADIYQHVRHLLIYSVITDDVNHDGLLDGRDPTYYFVSDRDGRGFRQVSPPGCDGAGWRLVPGTSRVLLNVVQDSNNDKHFNPAEDTVVPLVVDLATGQPAAPVFSPGFTTKMKTQLAKHWAKRK